MQCTELNIVSSFEVSHLLTHQVICLSRLSVFFNPLPSLQRLLEVMQAQLVFSKFRGFSLLSCEQHWQCCLGCISECLHQARLPQDIP